MGYTDTARERLREREKERYREMYCTGRTKSWGLFWS